MILYAEGGLEERLEHLVGRACDKLLPDGRRSHDAGVETLAGKIREYLRLAQSGEEVVVTDEGRPVAVLASIVKRDELRSLWELVDAGEANWKGGKPQGSVRPVKVRGKSLSSMVLEDRR